MFEKWKRRRIERNLSKLVSFSDADRKDAARTLARLGQPQWEKWVKGDQYDFRRLGNSREPWVFDALITALSKDSYRNSAIQGLGILGDPRAIEPIKKGMVKGSKPRKSGAKALAQLGQPEWEQCVKGDADDIPRMKESGYRPAVLLAEVISQNKERELRRKEARRKKREASIEDTFLPQQHLPGADQAAMDAYAWTFSLTESAPTILTGADIQPGAPVLPITVRRAVVGFIREGSVPSDLASWCRSVLDRHGDINTFANMEVFFQATGEISLPRPNDLWAVASAHYCNTSRLKGVTKPSLDNFRYLETRDTTGTKCLIYSAHS